MHRLTAIAAIALLSTSLSATAQTPSTEPEPLTAAKCLSVAPTTVFDMLDQNTRLDMLDYFRAGVERPSSNSMGGECMVLSESPEAITFRGGRGTMYQIFVLNPAGVPVIGVIETVDTPVPDSSVTFYSPRWQPLEGLLPAPTLTDWLRPEAAKQAAEVAEVLPFIMATYSYDPATGVLEMSNNMAQYYVASDTPAALQKVRPSLTYSWDGKKFKLLKP